MTAFRPMRRFKQQLPGEECIQILKQATSGVLALAGDDGYPYAVPISHVYADGRLYFHSALTGHKVDAIHREPKCSFCVVAQDEIHSDEFTTYYRSVIAFGKIQILERDEDKLQALRLLGERFSPGNTQGLQREIDKDFSHVLILRMDIEHLTGKEAKELMKARGQSK